MYDEDVNLYGLGQGCPVHGDENMHECHVCGHEFCKNCFSGSSICQGCASEKEEGIDDEFDESEPDFEDVKNVGALLEFEDDVDELVEEEMVLPDEFIDDSEGEQEDDQNS